MNKSYTIQYIFQTFKDKFIEKYNLSSEQWKVFNAIINCGTPNLGYHVFTCEECGEKITGFNSCRNRHCPMCGSYAR